MLFKAVLVQVVLFAALALALPAHVPDITQVDFEPTAPLLPSAFTAAFTERIITDGTDYVMEGYYYYDYDQQSVQADVTAPGAIISEVVVDGEMTITQLSGGEVTCFTTPYRFPLFSPDYFQNNLDFLGVSSTAHGRVVYAWTGRIFGISLVIFTDAQTGALVAEFGESFSVYFNTFEEGVPDSVFVTSCNQGRRFDLPRTSLLGNF